MGRRLLRFTSLDNQDWAAMFIIEIRRVKEGGNVGWLSSAKSGVICAVARALFECCQTIEVYMVEFEFTLFK